MCKTQREMDEIDKIEKITAEEKATLKIEVEEVNVQLEKGTITKEQADDKKKKLGF